MKYVYNDGQNICPQIHAFFYTKMINFTYFVFLELDNEGEGVRVY